MVFPVLPVTYALDGLNFNTGDDGGVSRIATVDGWDSSPDATPALAKRPTGAGSYRGLNFYGNRALTITGWSTVAEHRLRQGEFDRLAGICYDPASLFALSRTDETGQTLLLWCERSDQVVVQRMPDGLSVKYVIPLVATDPIKYGLPNPSVSTGLPTAAAGGAAWNGTQAATGFTGTEWQGKPRVASSPLTGMVWQTGSGGTGIITLTNDGSAEAPITFVITVASNGLARSPSIKRLDTGQTITFGENVPGGSTVVIDTLTGEVTLDGTDRGGSLTADDLFTVPPHSSIQVAFSALPGSHDTTLTATNSNAYV